MILIIGSFSLFVLTVSSPPRPPPFVAAVSFFPTYHFHTPFIALLWEDLEHIEGNEVHIMYKTMHTRYPMFHKFQAAMVMIVVSKILMHT